MGSSNAEKAERAMSRLRGWDEREQPVSRVLRYADEDGARVVETIPVYHPDYIAALRGALDARDAEVAELTRLLAESRAANGDSEARRAELEAALAKAREWLDGDILRSHDQWANLFTASSVVLEDRDREVAARALEDATLEFAEGAWNDAFRAGDVDDDISAVQATDAWFNARAAAIRKGDTT